MSLKHALTNQEIETNIRKEFHPYLLMLKQSIANQRLVNPCLSLLLLNIFIIVCVLLIQMVVTSGLTWMLFSALLIATRLRALSLILHDSTHFIASRSRRQNLVIGRVASMFFHVSFDTYRSRHLSHHSNVGGEERDFDYSYAFQRAVGDFRFRIGSTYNDILFSFVRYAAPRFNFRGEGSKWLALRISVHLGWIYAAFSIAGITSFIVLYFGTSFLFFPLLQLLGDYLEHGGIAELKEGLRSRNHSGICGPIRALLFSNNDQYHLIHHLFPSLPASLLADAERLLNLHSPTYVHATALIERNDV